MTSPTSLGALPGDVTPVGGIVLDLVGANGVRVVSQLPAGSLFEGFFNTGTPQGFRGNPGTIGIQTGFTPEVVNALGGGLAEVAVRLTVLDGDTSTGDFDHGENSLLLNGLAVGDFSRVATEETSEDGATALSANPGGGFRNDRLDTGFFYTNDPPFLASFYTAILNTGGVTVQLQDRDPFDNFFDFTAGIDGGLTTIGKPPAPVNAPPQIVSVTNNGPVPEGSLVGITVAASDPDTPAQLLTYQFDFDNDGAYEVSNTTGTAAHTFPDDGSFLVNVRVLDAGGGEARGSTAIQVVNAAPVFVAPAQQAGTAGTPATFALGSFVDPGADADWGVVIDWGDGSPLQTLTASQAGDLGALAHTYHQDGTYGVRVAVTDADGAAGSGIFAIEVANVAPVVHVPAQQAAVEGTPAAFALGQFDDQGADAQWQVVIDWGDGSPAQSFTAAQAGDLGALTHTYAQDGTYTVRVTVADGAGAVGSGIFAAEVANVAPMVGVPLNQVALEGVAASIALGRFDDPGADADWQVAIDWGDGAVQPLTMGQAGNLGALAHTYVRDGTYVVRVTVADDDGATGAATFAIDVANVAPVVLAPASQRGTEGMPLAVALGRFEDPGAEADWRAVIDWGDGTPAQALTFDQAGDLGALAHTYIQDGVYTIRVTVNDGKAEGSAELLVTARNVPPVLRTVSLPSQVALGSPVTLAARFTDPGVADRLTFVVDWGDGTTMTQSVPNGASTFRQSRLLAAPGLYGMTVTVLDNGGARDQFTTTVTVTGPAPSDTVFLLFGNPPGPVMNAPETIRSPGDAVRGLPVQTQDAPSRPGGRTGDRELSNAFQALLLGESVSTPPSGVPPTAPVPVVGDARPVPPGEATPEAPAPETAPGPAVPPPDVVVNTMLAAPNPAEAEPPRTGAIQTTVLMLSALLLHRHWAGSRASALGILRLRMMRGKKAPPPETGGAALAGDGSPEA
jgi:hypothetical protein